MNPRKLAILHRKAVALIKEIQPLEEKYSNDLAYEAMIMRGEDQNDNIETKIKLLLGEFNNDKLLLNMLIEKFSLDPKQPYTRYINTLMVLIHHIEEFAPVTQDKVVNFIKRVKEADMDDFSSRVKDGAHEAWRKLRMEIHLMFRNYDKHGPLYKSLISRETEMESISHPSRTLIRHLDMLLLDFTVQEAIPQGKELTAN